MKACSYAAILEPGGGFWKSWMLMFDVKGVFKIHPTSTGFTSMQSLPWDNSAWLYITDSLPKPWQLYVGAAGCSATVRASKNFAGSKPGLLNDLSPFSITFCLSLGRCDLGGWEKFISVLIVCDKWVHMMFWPDARLSAWMFIFSWEWTCCFMKTKTNGEVCAVALAWLAANWSLSFSHPSYLRQG